VDDAVEPPVEVVAPPSPELAAGDAPPWPELDDPAPPSAPLLVAANDPPPLPFDAVTLGAEMDDDDAPDDVTSSLVDVAWQSSDTAPKSAATPQSRTRREHRAGLMPVA
jgi:hypothetical protein